MDKVKIIAIMYKYFFIDYLINCLYTASVKLIPA